MASQAGRQAGFHLPRDSTTSQAVSAMSWEGGSLAASQAGSQADSHLPRDNVSFQASSTVFPNSIPAREGPSQAGNNPSMQADRQAVTQAGRQAVMHSSRCRDPRLPKGIALLLRQVALVLGKAPNPYPPN